MNSGLFERLQDEIDVRDANDGLSPIDLLDLPEAMATMINAIVRNNGMKLPDIAAVMELSTFETKKLLDQVIEKGYVRQVQVKNETWYKAQFGRKSENSGRTGIWSVLDELI